MNPDDTMFAALPHPLGATREELCKHLDAIASHAVGIGERNAVAAQMAAHQLRGGDTDTPVLHVQIDMTTCEWGLLEVGEILTKLASKVAHDQSHNIPSLRGDGLPIGDVHGNAIGRVWFTGTPTVEVGR